MGSAPPLPTTATPVAEAERLVALDLIRGIAVLGILLANITGYAHPDLAYYWPGALPGGGNAGDRWVWLVQFVAVDGKLRALFTILFGAGLVLFVERLGDDGRAVTLQVRRLAWLLLAGLLHYALLFSGDILFTYACAGLIALPFLRMDGQRALLLGVIWLVVAGLLQMQAYLTPMLVEAGKAAMPAQLAPSAYADFWTAKLAEAAQQARILGGDSLARLVRWRLVDQGHLLGQYFTWSFFETVPLLLLGMGFYRCGLFNASSQVMSQRRRWLAWAGLILGIGLTLATGLWVVSRNFPPLLTMFVFFGATPLTNLPLVLGGTVLLARWASRIPPAGQRGWLADRLVLAGRMAFTNYVGTSLAMALVFQGWAGGLFGQMHRVELLLVVALGWAMMLGLSRLWLARFRYGPLEWVWRCLTYWRVFPNRLPMG
ncbi:MAG: DUF418 domain-containing protein [Alteraurantiacibacter sp.]